MSIGNLTAIFGASGFDANALKTLQQATPEDQFRDAIESIGLAPDEIIADGLIHRCHGKDDRKKSGWYVLFIDSSIPAGAYGDWREGTTHQWHAESDRRLTIIEQSENLQRIAKAKRLRDEAQAIWREEAAEKAEDDLEDATEANPSHPYLVAKRIGAYGIRQLGDRILVPMVNGDGQTVRSYQSISPKGDKLFLKGGQAKGCYHLILGDTTTIYIGEGYATCATVFEATGSAVYTAFSASNLPEVATHARRQYPASRIVILGDNDPAGRQWSSKCEGADVIMATGEEGADFNDMGVDATRIALGIGNVSVVDPVDVVSESIEDEFSPIPDRLINLTGILGAIQRYTMKTATVSNPSAAAVGALSLVGTILANKVQTTTGLRSNQQYVLVAGTGTGKEHPRKINKAILMTAGLGDTHIGGEEIASGQGVMTAAGKRPCSLFQLDEFGMSLQAISNETAGAWQKAIISAYMKLHSGAGSIVAGQERADQDKRPRVDVLYPCVTLFATTTAKELVPALKSAQVASGYLNRMVFLLTKVKRQKRSLTARLTPPPSEVIDWIRAARDYHDGLIGMSPENPITVGMDGQSNQLFEEFEDEIMVIQDRGSTQEALYVRAWEHASKLAMISAMSKMTVEQLMAGEPCVIKAPDSAWAIGFVRFSFAELYKLIEGRVADTEFEGQCKEILRVIRRRKKNGATSRDIGKSSKLWNGIDNLQRDKILNSLLRDEEIGNLRIPTQSGRGRARVAWVATEFLVKDGDE